MIRVIKALALTILLIVGPLGVGFLFIKYPFALAIVVFTITMLIIFYLIFDDIYELIE